MNATDSWTRVTLMGLLHVVKSCGHPSHGSCCVHCGTWETYLHNQLCPVKVAERCADLNFSNQDRKVVLTPDVNGVSPDAVSGPERKRPDNTAHSSDCCSGFVTQEGRDIHQAIEHEPQNPDIPYQDITTTVCKHLLRKCERCDNPDFSDHPAPASLPTALRSRATDRGGGGETAP